jgi:hypothetical protein
MIVLGQKWGGWQSFRDFITSFRSFKSLMSNIDPGRLPETCVSEIMPIWKKRGYITTNVGQVHKGFEIIATWICCLVEYRLKSDTLDKSNRKLPEFERKVKKQ